VALFPTLASQIKRLSTVRLLPDVINAINLMVKGLSTSFTLPATDFSDSVIIQKDTGASAPALFVDNNVNGQHANFGGGVLTVADSGIASGPTAPFAIGSTLDVTGAAALHSTLGVTALSTLSGGFNAGASSSVTGNLGVSGNETVGGTLGVTALSTLSGGFNAGAPSSVTGTLTVSSTASVNGAPIAMVTQQAAVPANYQLTGTFSTPPSTASLTLGFGNWIVVLTCDFILLGADTGQTFQGKIAAGSMVGTIGNSGSLASMAATTAGQRGIASQTWPITVTGAGTIVMQLNKTGGSGTSQALGTHTNLIAYFVGKA